MTGTTAKQYGPRNRPVTLLDRAYKIPTENNDRPATKDVVDEWVDNFDRLSPQFRKDHTSLLNKLQDR